MKKVFKALIALTIIPAAVLLLPYSPRVAANPATSQIIEGSKKTGTESATSLEDTIANILGGVFILVGIISVVMIIYGGVKYSTSAGDSSKTIAAKNTITYAVATIWIRILRSYRMHNTIPRMA